MNKLIVAVSLLAVLVGCSREPAHVPTEAEIFGYKGHDIEDPDDKMFFSTGPGVTNWVPSRVLSVVESYEFSSNELAVIAAACIVTPAASFESIPDGYEKKSQEPWFTMWAKDVESFGKKGVSGFISHYNEVRKLWETGEPYFSTYYESETNALTALNELKDEIAKFAPKKFYDFDGCWVAEYVRLRVMGLCGQRPDGTWTCMLSLGDKCTPGCGPWEPVEAQQARIDEIAYKAELKAWKEKAVKLMTDNHEAVLSRAKASGIPMFGEEVRPQPVGDGRMVYVVTGAFPMSNAVDTVVWKEKSDELSKAASARLGEPKVGEFEGYSVWFAEGSNELFTVRLDVAFVKPSTNGVDNAVMGEWRQLCFVNVLPGFEPPPPPQRRK